MISDATLPGGEAAYYNGRWIPAVEASIPLDDAGFVLGATVTEQLRTFGGQLFRLDAHLARLARSLEITGVSPPEGVAHLAQISATLVAHNRAFMPPEDDLGLAMLVTPGPYRSFSTASARPLVCLHTYPLAFQRWADQYQSGVTLVTTDVRQIPADCWPVELKCRSRMHYFLADRAARLKSPGAMAVLLNGRGEVTEAPTANVLVYRRDGGLLSPPSAEILPGVTLTAVTELAQARGIVVQERPLRIDDLSAGDEILLTSTPWCLLPVTNVEGRPIGNGHPGMLYGQLLADFSRLVGVDIARQAAICAHARNSAI